MLNTINMVSSMAHGVMLPGMVLFADLILVCAVFGTLMFFVPYLTLILVAVFSIVTVILYYPFKYYNSRLGEKINQYSAKVFSDIIQSFEGIKETKLRNCEDVFSRRHAEHQKQLRDVQMMQYFMGQIPRFSIEAFVVIAGMGTLGIFILAGMAQGSMILKFSILTVAMVRLMPSFSRIQYCQMTMRHNIAAFNAIYNDMTGLVPKRPEIAEAESINLENAIYLKSVCFAYEGCGNCVDSLNLKIRRNSSLALTGPTGCGKTTVLDIILGLLKPTSGEVLVDDRNIEENLRSWQTKIGYVPQSIFLADASICENVAFGVPSNEIDEAHVRTCLEAAQLLNFVESLPSGLDTVVGERGVRLSGGQKQRIGIARALYCNPDILALDEATSALDSDTEKAFGDALNMLKGKLTIIMIAHRMATVEKCDTVIRMNMDHTIDYIKGEAYL